MSKANVALLIFVLEQRSKRRSQSAYTLIEPTTVYSHLTREEKGFCPETPPLLHSPLTFIRHPNFLVKNENLSKCVG